MLFNCFDFINISIHPPRLAAPAHLWFCVANPNFSTPALRAAAHDTTTLTNRDLSISIHALREEGDGG